MALASGTGRDPILWTCARVIWGYAALHSCEIEIRHKPSLEIPLANTPALLLVGAAAVAAAATVRQ